MIFNVGFSKNIGTLYIVADKFSDAFKYADQYAKDNNVSVVDINDFLPSNQYEVLDQEGKLCIYSIRYFSDTKLDSNGDPMELEGLYIANSMKSVMDKVESKFDVRGMWRVISDNDNVVIIK